MLSHLNVKSFKTSLRQLQFLQNGIRGSTIVEKVKLHNTAEIWRLICLLHMDANCCSCSRGTPVLQTVSDSDVGKQGAALFSLTSL